jgi:hypothetical protein
MAKQRTGKAPGRPKGSTDDPKKKRKGGRWNDETRAKHGYKPAAEPDRHQPTLNFQTTSTPGSDRAHWLPLKHMTASRSS